MTGVLRTIGSLVPGKLTQLYEIYKNEVILMEDPEVVVDSISELIAANPEM